MTRRIRAFAGAAVLSVAVLALALAVAPAALAGDPCFHGYTIPASTTVAGTAVGMEPCAFVPTNVQVEPGATVTFTNTSGEVHLLTGANQAWGDREKEIRPGESVSADVRRGRRLRVQLRDPPRHVRGRDRRTGGAEAAAAVAAAAPTDRSGRQRLRDRHRRVGGSGDARVGCAVPAAPPGGWPFNPDEPSRADTWSRTSFGRGHHIASRCPSMAARGRCGGIGGAAGAKVRGSTRVRARRLRRD